MTDVRPDPRRPLDPAINSPGREGLTGTAPASLYAPGVEREQITIAPNYAPADVQPAWRQDFPIDWPQDLYVERRDFMKFLVLTSAAFTLGQAVDRRPELVPEAQWPAGDAADCLRRRCGRRRGGCLHLPGRTRTLSAGAADDERVRRLWPEVHALVLRRDSPAGRRTASTVRATRDGSTCGRAHLSPGRHAGR